MSEKFEFIGTEDRPALLAFSTPEWLDATRGAAEGLGYLVHTAATPGDFLLRFGQRRYQLVVLEECFAANSLAENLALRALQSMAMTRRRHATVVLLGDSFQTFTPTQAFELSVHAVINTSELFLLKPLLEKAVGDKNRFLPGYRDAESRTYASGDR